MTEREKLIQLIKAGHEKASYYFHKEAMAILKQGKSYSSKDRTKTFDEFVADTLIENGIGDIAEWKEKYAKLEKSDTSKENCTIEQHEEIHWLRDKLKQTQKESDEWKARAERAECILSEYNHYSEVINNKLDKAIELVNGMLKQVKSEEERK